MWLSQDPRKTSISKVLNSFTKRSSAAAQEHNTAPSMITLTRSSRSSRFGCIRPGVTPTVRSLASSSWTPTGGSSHPVSASWKIHTHTATSTAALCTGSSSDDTSTRGSSNATSNITWGHTASAINGGPSLSWSASRWRASSLSVTNNGPLPSTGSSRASATAGWRHRQPSLPAPPPLPPQQPQQQIQQTLPQHMLVLQQQQRLQQARAERAGLPVPPPATGKGGRGKLVFPQSDSFRFVLHIRELTQDKNLAGVLAALTIAERKEGGVDVHGYSACIGGMAKAKRWADALGLLSRMRAAGVAPNTQCFSNAIQACCRCGEYRHVPALRREMAAAGVPHTLACYRLELEHFGNSGQWSQALRLLSDLEGAGLTPDAKIYNGVLDAFAQSTEWFKAGEVMKRMVKAGHKLHARSYRGVIVAAANAGKWRVAWRFFRRMTSLRIEKSSRSPVIYNSVTAACGAGGRWKEALHALRLTSRDGMDPTFIAYNATLGALGKAGQWQRAQHLLEEMRRASHCAHNRLAASQRPREVGTERGLIGKGAAQVRGSTRLAPPDVYSYTSVINACAKSGQLQRALEVLERMRRARVSPSLVTFNALILACGTGGGEWRRALGFVGEMIDAGVKPDAYTFTLALAACEAGGGEWNRVSLCLREMGGKVKADPVLGRLTIAASGRAGDWRGGLRVVEEMGASGAPPDVGVYNALIEALSAGRPRRPEEG